MIRVPVRFTIKRLNVVKVYLYHAESGKNGYYDVTSLKIEHVFIGVGSLWGHGSPVKAINQL